jgi:hypothetical protein
MGQSGIESYMEHEEEAEIQQLLFLVNEVTWNGLLVTNREKWSDRHVRGLCIYREL